MTTNKSLERLIRVNRAITNKKGEDLYVMSYYWGGNGWYVVCETENELFVEAHKVDLDEDNSTEDLDFLSPAEMHIHELAFNDLASRAGFNISEIGLKFYTDEGDSSVDKKELMSESIFIEIAAVLDNAVFDDMTRKEKIGLVFSQARDSPGQRPCR